MDIRPTNDGKPWTREELIVAFEPWLARTLGNLGWRDKIGLIRKEAFRYTTCLSFQE